MITSHSRLPSCVKPAPTDHFLIKPAAIKTQLHIAEILLYEVGIHDDLSAALSTTERLELLWECLKATRSMLEARFEIPMVERPRQTCLSSFDYTYAMLTSLRLSTLALPGWDLALVRRELDAGKFLDVQIQEVKWLLEKRSRGAWRADDYDKENSSGDSNNGGKGGAGRASRDLRATLDPLETLYKRLLELRVPLQAELLAAIERESGGGGGREAAAAAAAAAAAPSSEPADVPPGEEQLVAAADPAMLDFMQDLEGPFWQAMYRVNEWETNFSSLFGWGQDDQGAPVDAGSRLENPDSLGQQIPMAMRL